MTVRQPATEVAAEELPAAAGRGDWTRFAIRRLSRFVVSLAVLVTATFWMIHLVPGDPVRAALGSTASAELVERMRAELHLDRPLVEQFVHYLAGLVRGELGTSQIAGLPVDRVIADRLAPTLTLAVAAFVVVAVVAFPGGMAAGQATWRRWRPLSELSFSGTTSALAAVPDFLIGVALVFVFAIVVPVLPVAGRGGPESYVLPVAALAAGPIGLMLRIVRAETVRVLGQDYVRTARAKRMSNARTFLRHVLPNVVTPTLTLSGQILSGLLAGTVLVENLFAWPGLGTALTQSVLARDYALVQGLALVFGAGVLLINLVVDVVISVVDPRTTLRGA